MMTLKQSLELTVQMWDWLAENPSQTKTDFLVIHPKYPQTFLAKCALCAYSKQPNGLIDCNICPLKEFWKSWYKKQYDDIAALKQLEEDVEGKINSFCEPSAFGDWLDATDHNERSRIARAIADAAREELKKL
jgi:hypothetical protein